MVGMVGLFFCLFYWDFFLEGGVLLLILFVRLFLFWLFVWWGYKIFLTRM